MEVALSHPPSPGRGRTGDKSSWNFAKHSPSPAPGSGMLKGWEYKRDFALHCLSVFNTHSRFQYQLKLESVRDYSVFHPLSCFKKSHSLQFCFQKSQIFTDLCQNNEEGYYCVYRTGVFTSKGSVVHWNVVSWKDKSAEEELLLNLLLKHRFI